jgi:FAD/FMN-containing dehydrogenase/ferredoxin
MNDFAGCDANALLVTVGAGMVWNDLQVILAERGLGLRLYPTSAPSSTVAGWLAQGGAGIGSYAFGWFAENVRAARVVTGAGDVRTFRGADLAAISDAEGTTGIVTQVTLDVEPAASHAVVALTFPTPRSMVDALRMIGEEAVPVWSAQFVNPTMAQLANRSTRRDGELAPGHWPDMGYTCLLAYNARDTESVDRALDQICSVTSGARQPSSIAESRWAERFRPMRLKRLGPSLLPVEIVVPLANLARLLEEFERRIEAPLAVEGLLVRGNEVVLIGFVPHDERTTAYSAGHGFVLSAMRAAEECGGRPYSIGRFFASRAGQVLGDQRVQELKAWKTQNDPAGVLNPGKVVDPPGLLGNLVDAGCTAEPLLRMIANKFGKPGASGGRHARSKTLLPDIVDHAYACAQCGYCVDVCPQFQDAGWESSGPRGKWFLLKEVLERRDRFDIELTDIFGLCAECGRCDAVCQLELPIESSWRRMKASLFDGVLTRTS